MSVGDRFNFDASAVYQIYNYENAFAFNVPTAERKTLETATGIVAMTYRMTDTLSLVGEFHYRDVTSNDTRIEYARNQILLGIRWIQ